ncbi:MAG: response regulator transcription factor [Prevotellaceae bacterium]|nr:response regulator transcription factor [Prevotellaceae bacterium]
MRILVVDDEQDLCEILQYNLEAEGYEIDTACSAEEAMGKDLETYDLILLDVMMGAMSGFQLARYLKGKPQYAAIPIIFITALDGEDDTLKGFNLGADDYIAKPLSLKEVKARVKAVLRRTAADKTDKAPEREATVGKLVHDTLVLDLEGKSATMDGQKLPLTKLEFELVALFLQHPGKLFNRESLLEHCWPAHTVVMDRTVDVNIARIRKKLGRYGKQLKARFGYGYTFEE